MSLICAQCGKTIVISDTPEHYGICSSCPHTELGSMIVEKSSELFGLLLKAKEHWKDIEHVGTFTFTREDKK